MSAATRRPGARAPRVAAAAIAAIALGCTELLPADERADGGPVPAGLARPPPPPTTPDAADGPRLVFALRAPEDADGRPLVFLDQRRDEAWRRIGFDLDGVLSVAPDPVGSCRSPADGLVAADGDAGRDNRFGPGLFPVIETALPSLDLERETRETMRAGVGSIVVTVEGWSGRDDDPSVILTGHQSYGVAGAGRDEPPAVTLDAGGRPRVDGALAPPAWDGDDWHLRFDDTGGGFLSDPAAYVAGGTFVGRFDAPLDVPFAGFGRGVLVRLTRGAFTARRRADGHLDVLVVGRWARGDFLETARRAFCGREDDLLELAPFFFDQHADLRADGSNRPGSDCDAISVALPLEGVPARLAEATLPPPGVPGC